MDEKYVGLAAGIFTSISLLPQLIKIIKERDAEGISIPMLFVLFTGLALWTLYGFLKNDLPIMVTNSFSLLVNIVIIILRFKYKNHHQNGTEKKT